MFNFFMMTGLETPYDPLSEEELLELEEFLMSEATSATTMTLDALNGFLTALVIGPVTVMPGEWIPYVLDTSENEAPVFASHEQVQRIMLLLMRYMNSLVYIFQEDPDEFLPLFDLCSYSCKEDEDAAVTAWSQAFMFGMELHYDEWTPIFEVMDEDGEEAAVLLGPIFLLAGHEHESHQLTPTEREQLKAMVAESVSDIYRFWLPYRSAAPENQESVSKKSRIITLDHNDPCPCGSGKRYQNCCGTKPSSLSQ
jgi:uncharacterized protein